MGAGKMLTEGVDPSRGVWQSWQDLRSSSAEHWYPGEMKAVAFVFNKVSLDVPLLTLQGCVVHELTKES